MYECPRCGELLGISKWPCWHCNYTEKECRENQAFGAIQIEMLKATLAIEAYQTGETEEYQPNNYFAEFQKAVSELKATIWIEFMKIPLIYNIYEIFWLRLKICKHCDNWQLKRTDTESHIYKGPEKRQGYCIIHKKPMSKDCTCSQYTFTSWDCY